MVSGAVAKATTVPAGACTFTPNANEHGIDSPAVTLTDGAVQISRTLTLDVMAVSDAPMAVADSYATAFNTALTIAAAGVPGNDSDPDGDALTAILATDVADGTLVLNANGASPIRHVRASDGTAFNRRKLHHRRDRHRAGGRGSLPGLHLRHRRDRARHRTGATAPRDSIQLLGLGTGASVSETAPGAYAIQHAGGTVGTFQAATGLVVGQDILFA